MNKNTVRAVAALAVLLVLYVLVVFLVPFVMNATFWASFVFTLIAFVVVGVAFYLAFCKNPDAKSKFYGFPIARIGAIYGLVQLGAGLLFMSLALWVPVWAAVLVYAIALGVTSLGLISADAVVEQIQVQDQELKKNVSLMRNIQSKVSHMEALCEDTETAAAVRVLSDELRYSDPVSGEGLDEIEADLDAAVNELQSAVVDGDSAAAKQLCRKASALLAERNRLCKLNKA